MKTFEINTDTNGQIAEFLDQYQIWKDYNNFYNQDPGIINIQKSKTGIPWFHYTDVGFRQFEQDILELIL